MKLLFNLFLFFSVNFLAFGCNSMTYKVSEDEKIADKITEETAKKLQEKNNLVLIGTGGRMMYDIEMLAMSFHYYHEVDLKSARKLITTAVNEYLSNINNNKEIRPYLANYPFISKNVEIRIFIYGPDRRDLPPEKISSISSRKGVINYYTHSENDRYSICMETYNEALQEIASSEGVETESKKTNEEVVVTKDKAKDGAKVRISAASFKHSLYQLKGSGFKPHESLNCVSTSCGEVLYFRIKADEKGELSDLGLMPTVIGKSGGTCRIDILRKGAPLHLKYPWGTEALE